MYEQGPVNFTPNSLLMSGLGMFGFDMRDPLSAQMGQQLLSFLKGAIIQPYMGISANDPLWNATLYSNMTNFGIMMQNMNAQANSVGISKMMQQQAASRYQFFQGWQRTATSQSDFAKLVAQGKAGGFTDYDAFIEHKTQGMMDNTVLNMLMQMSGWDPTGQMMAGFNMREASANVARQAMWRGDENWRVKADRLGDIFLNRNGSRELDYRKSEYGMMSLNESSALLAILTKNQPFAAGAQTEQQIEDELEKLRTRMKNLTRAMSPLKDFFGDDVPSMVRFLEEISGKGINQLDSQTVANLTKNLSNGVATGAFTLDQVQKMTMQLQGSFAQMNTPYYLDTVAGSLSQNILMAVNSGNTPLMMSQASYRQAVAERQMRQAASPYANNVNLAYSMWEQRNGGTYRNSQGERDSEAAMAAFREDYNNLLRRGYNEESALLQLSGASSMQQLYDRGTRSIGYSEAVSAGLGMDIASAAGVRRRAASIILSESSVAARQGMDTVINAFMNGMNGMTTDEIDRMFQGMRESKNADEQAQYAAWSKLQQDKHFMAFNVDLHKNAQQRDAGIAMKRANELRERTLMMEELFGSIMENDTTLETAVTNLIINNGKGFSLDDIRSKYKDRPLIMDALQNIQSMSQEDKENLKMIKEAGGMKAVKDLMTGAMSDPDREAALKPFLAGYKDKTVSKETLTTALNLSTSALNRLTDDGKNIKQLNNIIISADKQFEAIKDNGLDNEYYRDRYWSGWKSAKEKMSDEDFQKELKKHHDAYVASGPSVERQRMIRREMAKKVMEDKEGAVSDVLKQAKTIITNYAGDNAEALLQSYQKDVILGKKSEKDWSDEQLKGYAERDDIMKQLSKVGQAVNTSVMQETGLTSAGLSPEQAMAMAFSDGGIFEKLNKVLDDLGGALKGLPELITSLTNKLKG